ncbi:MAG: hypothetical protein M5U01_13525 [Ardenticatenaceae bacterium]|nr:hypothetical protein [Ardenticatenaceae bacterium]
MTEQFGAQVEQQRVAPVAAVAAAGDDPAMALTERVAPVAPVAAPANISSDGAMVRLRGEGYKEVKLTAISSLSQAPVPATRRGYAPSAPEPRLSAHSYQAGLWDADEFAAHQYVEGLRRQVGQTATLTSVNDGAPWIRRVTATNFPTATLILDWHHAEERLQVVADYAFSNPATQREWCATTTEQLWQGQLQAVVTALDDLGLTADSAAPDLVRHSPGSFQNTADATDSPAYRALGLPLGSGTVESAANTLVHHRMRRQGPGWNRDAGHAMLAALSELHSDRFERAWADSQPALAP